MFTSADYRFMDAALALAQAQLGRTAPNPAVGCVIVRDGMITGWGATADGGRPHAERQALDRAGPHARAGRAYVTLEPCAFHGQTPPCATALIESGVETVLIACLDEHPKVAGRGVALLRDAGIAVETGLRNPEAAQLYAGFFHRLRTGQPLVYLDANSARYDAVLTDAAMHAPTTELDRLGKAGMNRVCIAPGSALATRLVEAGMATTPVTQAHTAR
ncbi:bifunctional diaminohydroxyphosphoribosylaminopyrimidine deaminase/5-amino-6-(5-phosphoribosylamino)uracil reductase RibD [Maricaulis salignorans]|uniref:bifunctional diaminohydroxyphosphoribosylaminopyrimidine deaminase/5-amino-6-(5-phosphoribosylamino)uracil reductase RibD n=1 Tax=Maricaulis salignorans TaxID=144026 RepID=UPI003A942035